MNILDRVASNVLAEGVRQREEREGIDYTARFFDALHRAVDNRVIQALLNAARQDVDIPAGERHNEPIKIDPKNQNEG